MHDNVSQVTAGWVAFDEAGDKIGDVAEVGPNYVLVQKGLLFPKDIYIPFSSVSRTNASDASLTVAARKDDLDGLGWDAPPIDDGRTTSGITDDASMTTDSDYGRTGSAYGSATTQATDDTVTVPLREERLQTERRQRDAGEVTVGKRVTEQQQEMDVPVTRDEVEITRRRVDRPAGADDTVIDEGDTIRVPLRAEEVDVRKDARVVEEVEISKRPVTETRRVSDTVRREEVDVDTSGDVLTGAGAGAARMSRSDLDDDAGINRGARTNPIEDALTGDESEEDPYRR